MKGLDEFTIHDYDRYVDAQGGMTDDRGLRVDVMVVECGRRGMDHLVESFMAGEITAGQIETALASGARS